jgi:2-polyprenyl-3-methyl-5-hydroxy-6-metoxy-1,4-benzoquinol methylase
MINWLHAFLHRPERGWDPVSPEHAAQYAVAEWQSVNEAMLDELEQWVGGFQGKRILDLGGGPGQYSVAIAKRGGKVTWHDVSTTYRDFAQQKAKEFAVADRIEFSLGYLDEAPNLLLGPYDFVFNRICWNYGFTDQHFSKVVNQMVRPGGFCYIDTTHSGYKRDKLSTSALIRTWLNETLSIKIGHPYPPRGRLANLFLHYSLKRLVVDYRAPWNDRIMFEKAENEL